MRRLGLAVLFVAPALTASAGPWAAGRGRLYAKLSYEFLGSDTLAQPDGTRLGIPDFVKQGSGLYLAYGLSEGVTLVGDVPTWRSSDLRGFGREAGFGDLRLGAQVQIARRGGWHLAARGVLQAPTGDETRGGGLLPTGSGAWEAEGVLGAGRSLGRSGAAYVFVELGHQLRGSGLRDGFLYGLQAGWNATRALTLSASLRGVEPYSHAPLGTPIGSPVGVSDRVTYAYYGPSASLRLGRNLALQADADFVFNARNLATGVTWRGSVVYSGRLRR